MSRAASPGQLGDFLDEFLPDIVRDTSGIGDPFALHHAEGEAV